MSFAMNRPETQNVATEPAGKGFWALIVTQFQGAFSDNALKNLVIFMVIGMNLPPGKRQLMMLVIPALFIVPFIIFSMAGGYFADHHSKRNVTVAIKIFEILVMIFATISLASHVMSLILAALFLMGVHSAIFGPSKYGLLPELLPERKLSWGNGVLEFGTFVAIILGTMVGGLLSNYFHGQQQWSGAILIGLAVIGFFTSLGIPHVPPAGSIKKFEKFFIIELWDQVQDIRKDRVLWLAMIGSTYFWFIGMILQLNIIIYGKDILNLTDTRNSCLQAALAIGIGIGSLAAGYLSGGKIEYGLIPLGAAGLSALGFVIGLFGQSFASFASELALLGFFGGFFAVPVSALLQHRPDKDKKGGVLAVANLLSSVGLLIAAGVYYAVTAYLHLSPSQIFVWSALVTLAGTIYVVILLPDALLRFVLWLITCTIYRVRVEGRENIPAKGGALFVCNHVSFVDTLLLFAATDRHVRFMMFKDHYDKPFIKPFVKMLGVIPISSEQRPRDMLKSLQTAAEAIRNGEVVCIFAEGQITRIGQLLPFRRGMERIMKDVDAPIIPVVLDGVYGAPLSMKEGRLVLHLPRHIPYPITVAFGKPLPSKASAFEVRQAVQELMSDAWHDRRKQMLPLHRGFVRSARKHPRRFAMADAQSPNVTFGSALVRTVFLARRLRKAWSDQKMVGLLLPPSVPGALVNWAAMLCGKVPVNLNYTVSEQTLASCITQCDIKTVVTSRVFLEKIKLTVPGEVIFLEDLAANPRLAEKLAAFFMAKFLPVRWLERSLQCEKKTTLDDIATVIFSSGSTGEPKGVMLSHYNIASNVAQVAQVYSYNHQDRVLGILPFFHSFGFTGTLSLPALLGGGVVFHPNPLDSKSIGPLVRDHNVTFLLATPTFLQIYMRGCNPADFGGLRVVMTGAEKLPDRLALAFEEQFGIKALEGYGCTECAPAVAVNSPDFRGPGFRQVGSKRGKIGLPLPGICVRIVNLEDPRPENPLPVGTSGLLLVRGPNIMVGYLGKPEKTAEVLHDGWYTTGDVAMIDEDGFLQITDRLSRFSKIGGEMVPHIKVEEKLHELADATEQTFIVTSAPDEKKGERLVVLTKLANGQLQTCLDKLAQSDLPNLWKPRAESFLHVDTFPMLGTGKLDLRKVKEIAAGLGREKISP